MIVLASALTIISLILLLHWRYKNRKLLEVAKQIPGPPVWPLVGNAWMFMCRSEDFIAVIQNTIRQYGDVLRFWLGPELNVVVNNPDDVKILLTNSKTSVKGPQYKYMVDILGGGILSGSGPVWRRHRKLATANYSKKAVEGYTCVFNQETNALVDELRKIPERKQFNIYSEVIKCTTYAVCRTIMGLSKDEALQLKNLEEIVDLSPGMYEVLFKRMTIWYLQIDPVFWLTDLYRYQKHFLSLMNAFGEDIIERRQSGLASMDQEEINLMFNSERDHSDNVKLSIIDRFLLSNEFTKEELILEIFTLFTSSQEASGKICSYLLLMMAFHPTCQEKLYEEIKRVIPDEETEITEEHFKRMPYLDLAYKEVLRLFPIGALLQRTVQEDITISTCTIPANSSLVIPLYHMQRDERFWKNPEDFDPERFTPENSKSRHPNCYIPFSLGPMDCLGRYFGTKLIKTIVVRVLQKFELTSNSSYKDMRLGISISVFSLDGYPVILTPRK